MIIKKGTRIRWTAIGQTSAVFDTPSVEELRSAAIAFIDDYMTVNSLSVDRDSGGMFGFGEYGYTATIETTTRVDHGGIDGPLKVIRDAFEEAAGAVPTVSAMGYTPDQPIGPRPGGTNEEEKPSILPSLGTFVLLALIAVTATAVFVAKRG
ncbi:MAG TPA: hypothetical protein VJ842_14340 [Pyrinomonadaceae bacterium]|nr:hypothetical protein [Pyrinomonadaceae bacterium]